MSELRDGDTQQLALGQKFQRYFLSGSAQQRESFADIETQVKNPALATVIETDVASIVNLAQTTNNESRPLIILGMIGDHIKTVMRVALNTDKSVKFIPIDQAIIANQGVCTHFAARAALVANKLQAEEHFLEVLKFKLVWLKFVWKAKKTML